MKTPSSFTIPINKFIKTIIRVFLLLFFTTQFTTLSARSDVHQGPSSASFGQKPAKTYFITCTIKNRKQSKGPVLLKLLLQKGNENRLLSESFLQSGDSATIFEMSQMPDEGVLVLEYEGMNSYHVWKKQTGKNQKIEFNSAIPSACPAYNSEQIAYASLMEAYAHYDSTFFSDLYKSKTLSPQIQTDYLAALFITNRHVLNKNIQQLITHFPQSFAAKTASSFLLFPELRAGQAPGYEYVHSQYFKLWNFTDSVCMLHPVCAVEISRYLNYFGYSAAEYNLNPGISILYNNGLTTAPKEIRDFFTDFLITQFMQMPNNEGDRYLLYIYNQFIAGCNESGAENHFIKSIPNMENMKVGKKIPDFTIEQADKIAFNLYNSNPSAFTFIFLWKPHCPYCESILPEIKKLAARYPNQLQVIAISLDNNEKEWQQLIADNKKRINWKDLSEHKGFESPALSAYYFKGTPTAFLLNRDFQIVSRSIEAAQLEKLIHSKNN